MRINISQKVALTTFLTAGAGVLVFASLTFMEVSGYFKQNLLSSLSQTVQSDANEIINSMNELENDILSLSKNEAISGMIRADANKFKYDAIENATYNNWIKRFRKVITVVLEQNEHYYQIRLIGIKDGKRELINALKRKESIYFKKEDELKHQNIKDNFNDNFNDSFKFKKGKTYISDIVLKRDQGVVSKPIMPIIKMSLPIYKNDEVFAILVINASTNSLFQLVNKDDVEGENVFVINSMGDYLYNKDKSKMFGFEFGQNHKLQNEYDISSILSQSTSSLSFYSSNDIALSAKKIYLDNERFIVYIKTATNKFLNQQSLKYKKQITVYIVIIIMFIVLFTAIITRYLTVPIILLTKKAKEVAASKGDVIVDFNEINSNDEIGELSDSLKVMLDNLLESKKEIKSFASSLETQIAIKTQELQELNADLEIKVENGIEELRTKDSLIAQQTKLASMGEMIGSIAHQWRQPLNSLHINIEMLEEDFDDEMIDKVYLEQFIKKNTQTLQFMSKTIDDFRNFFRVDKEKIDFDIKEKIENTLTIQSAQLKEYNIEVILKADTFITNGFPGEFQQVILNIVNNSKDALVENNITNGTINIEILTGDKIGTIFIEDNAGGISSSVIQRVFEPYFTTKEQGKGTGMGLYMSKMIIEKNMNGKIYVENINDGVRFTIKLGRIN